MITALLLAALFPGAGHAAAWGVLIAGILEALLLMGNAARADVLARLRCPKWDADVGAFFRALGPAVVGSAGVQLALFADTLIATFLPAGALSALYYADRLNQLPIGVIGIAAGTVVLPEMAQRLAAGDGAGAQRAQNRAIELTLLLSLPCLVAFLVVPELIIRALFMRGAFTATDAAAAAATLSAYALGLLPFVLIRSMTATFFARGDTATPVKAALAAAAVNIVFKVLLMGPLAQVGLALATSIGAWINLALVYRAARRENLVAFDARLRRAVIVLVATSCVLGIVLLIGDRIAAALFAGRRFADVLALAALVVTGAIVYFGILAVILRENWRALVRPASG
jgi:putative peptidoglycan lipid II flippase